MHGSKNEPLMGNDCHPRLSIIWKSAMAKMLLPMLLNSQTIITRIATVLSVHQAIHVSRFIADKACCPTGFPGGCGYLPQRD
ncbi:hypothetical protein ABIB50_002696 [Mucilaginibacter sp. UYCu711]